VINPEYADPQTFDQVFDIFSTQSLTSAHLIEYQFGQPGPNNDSIFEWYDSGQLNKSESVIQSTIQQGTPAPPGFMFAILQAYNATGTVDDPPNSNSTGANAPPNNGSSPNTALAMCVHVSDHYTFF
jgi:hypothetical protein